jgi:hypothetical protein
VYNDIISQEDWLPTLLAAAGAPGIKDRLTQSYQVGGKTWRVHLDWYDFLPYFKGAVPKGPREEIYYFGQGGELNAVRWNDWKVHFAVQQGNIATSVREVTGWPTIMNLRADPYEKAPYESGMYIRWYGGQHLALRARSAEAQGLSGHRARVSVPGGEQPECRQHQLHDLEGRGSPEAAEGAGEPVAPQQLTHERIMRKE